MRIKMYCRGLKVFESAGNPADWCKAVKAYDIEVIEVAGVQVNLDDDEYGVAHRARRVLQLPREQAVAVVSSGRVTLDLYVLLTTKRIIYVTPYGVVLQIPHCVPAFVPINPIPLELDEASLWDGLESRTQIEGTLDLVGYHKEMAAYLRAYPRAPLK